MGCPAKDSFLSITSARMLFPFGTALFVRRPKPVSPPLRLSGPDFWPWLSSVGHPERLRARTNAPSGDSAPLQPETVLSSAALPHLFRVDAGGIAPSANLIRQHRARHDRFTSMPARLGAGRFGPSLGMGCPRFRLRFSRRSSHLMISSSRAEALGKGA
jgi:hypothetical protein